MVPRDREENVADDASPRQPPQMRRTLSKSLDEEDFHRAVKSRHPPANAKGNLMHSSTSDDLRGDLKPLKKLQEVPRWAKML